MENPFVWLPTYQKCFERLKKSFISTPVLYHLNHKRKIIVQNNASYLVITGLLLEYDNYDILHPVIYFSRKDFPGEINYEIYNKGLLTIVGTFKGWCPLLEGSPYTIEVISDN
jgi:hypothetical protein